MIFRKKKNQFTYSKYNVFQSEKTKNDPVALTEKNCVGFKNSTQKLVAACCCCSCIRQNECGDVSEVWIEILYNCPKYQNTATHTTHTQHSHSVIVYTACYNMFAVVHTSKNKQTSGELHICCVGLTGAGHIHLFMNVFMHAIHMD